MAVEEKGGCSLEGPEGIGPECLELLRSRPELIEIVCRSHSPEGLAESLTSVLSALSSPLRLKLVMLLARAREPVPLCLLALAVGKSPQQLTYHIKVLRDAGLVAEERRGRFAFYQLNRGALEELVRRLALSLGLTLKESGHE